MAKQGKHGGGWAFPAPLEILICKEGNKEYMKERRNKPGGRLMLVCEYQLSAADRFGGDDARLIWWLAQTAARDFLRVSWITTAVVRAFPKENAVRVFGKY